MKPGWAYIASIAFVLAAATAHADEAKTGATAAQKPAGKPTITNPDWISLPSGEQFDAYYPDLAQILELGGQATMSCTVTATGALTNCSVASEAPAGVGFGQAALGMSKLFKMRPLAVDGHPVGGANVVIPIKFTLPETPTDSADAEEASSSPINPDALVLGRRLAVATGVRAEAETNFLTYIHALQLRLGDQADTPEAKATLEAYAAGAESAGDAYAEAMAAGYARSFTLVELHQMIDFFESSAGQVWVMNQGLTRMKIPAMAALLKSARLGAVQALCQKTHCPPEDQPAK